MQIARLRKYPIILCKFYKLNYDDLEWSYSINQSVNFINERVKTTTDIVTKQTQTKLQQNRYNNKSNYA